MGDSDKCVSDQPGAGCSTFLKTLAHEWTGFLSVKGDLRYNGLSAEETKRKFKGELAYAREAVCSLNVRT